MTNLSARLGDEDAERIIQVAGGRRLSIPEGLEKYDTRQIEKLFGRELSIKLILHFGGRTIYVPRNGMSKKVSLRRVVYWTKRDKSASWIAQRLGCSDRTVYSCRKTAIERGLLQK